MLCILKVSNTFTDLFCLYIIDKYVQITKWQLIFLFSYQTNLLTQIIIRYNLLLSIELITYKKLVFKLMKFKLQFISIDR